MGEAGQEGDLRWSPGAESFILVLQGAFGVEIHLRAQKASCSYILAIQPLVKDHWV